MFTGYFGSVAYSESLMQKQQISVKRPSCCNEATQGRGKHFHTADFPHSLHRSRALKSLGLALTVGLMEISTPHDLSLRLIEILGRACEKTKCLSSSRGHLLYYTVQKFLSPKLAD